MRLAKFELIFNRSFVLQVGRISGVDGRAFQCTVPGVLSLAG